MSREWPTMEALLHAMELNRQMFEGLYQDHCKARDEIARLWRVIEECNNEIARLNEQANEHGKMRARVAELETLLRDVREEITTQDSANVIRKYALPEIDRALAL